jgi:hypothetical protein
MNLTDYTRETLRGLQGVLVVIEGIREDAEADGLKTEDLQTHVELTLVKAGLRVLPHEEWRTVPGRPWLYVSVNTIRYLASYFFSVDVQLKQDISLVRSPAITSSSSTWELGSIGYVDTEGLCAKILDSVDGYLDRFITDFRAANSE